MARSNRLLQLERRLSEIRRAMLPQRFSKTGGYSSRIVDRTRGYLLLAHAEIEAYVEDVARDILDDATARWGKINTATKRTIGTVVEEMLKQATERQRARLQNNHGIKEKNLANIFEPLGINIAGVDNVWLAAMTSFGSSRGVVAHTSSIGAMALPDPKDALKSVHSLILGLRKIDRIAQAKLA